MIPVMPTPTERAPLNETEEQAPISKSQRKRESLALQDLGEALLELSQEQVSELDLPERLLDAVLAAKAISKFGARKRQLQYIGRLMRGVDGEAIAARLESWKGHSRKMTTHLHLLERWRARLLEDEAALTELSESYPGCDTQKLRQLLRNVRREHDEGKPTRSYRALFQELRLIVPDAHPGMTEGFTPPA
jgi:ribosome-associated protein